MKKVAFLTFLTIAALNVKSETECPLAIKEERCLDRTTLETVPTTIIVENFLQVGGPYDSLTNHQRNLLVGKNKFQSKDEHSLKLALFYAFTHYVSKLPDPEASDFLAHHMMALFTDHESEIVDLLDRLPVFIESTCFYLAKYFDLDEDHGLVDADINDWWNSIKKKFRHLHQNSVDKCQNFFTDNESLEKPYQ